MMYTEAQTSFAVIANARSVWLESVMIRLCTLLSMFAGWFQQQMQLSPG